MNSVNHMNNETSNSRFGWIGNAVGFGVLFIGLLGPLLWLYLAQEASINARSECINSNGPRSTVEGVVRRAGPSMYVQGSTWRWIAGACSGKHESDCLRRDHGPALLAANIGKSVTAEFCGREVISYTVAGKRFQY